MNVKVGVPEMAKIIKRIKRLAIGGAIAALPLFAGPGFAQSKTDAPQTRAPQVGTVPHALNPLFVLPKDGAPPAVVDGQKISWREYNVALQRAAQVEFYHRKVPKGKIKELREKIINKMVLGHLLDREVGRLGLAPDEADVKKQIARLEQRYKGNKKWEAQRKVILPKLRAALEKISRRSALEAKVRTVKKPTLPQLKDFYSKNAKLFTEPSTQRVSVILLGVTPSSSTEVWKKAKEEAGRILLKIKKGGDFAAVAKLRSTDASAKTGGDLGYLHKGMLSDEAQKVVDAMKVGAVSEPVRILQGYALFKLHDRTPPRLVAFKKSRARARELYRRIKGQKQWDKLKQNLREHAKIMINPVLLQAKKAKETTDKKDK